MSSRFGVMLAHYIENAAPGSSRRRKTPSAPAISPMQAELVCRRPGAPIVVRHRDVGPAQERKGVVHRIGEARYAADIRAFADALGADRMVRRRRRGPVGFPLWGFDRRRKKIVHQRSGGHVAILVIVDLLAH